MKKIASMFLAFAMMLSLVACGGGEQQSNASENSGKIDTSDVEPSSITVKKGDTGSNHYTAYWRQNRADKALSS